VRLSSHLVERPVDPLVGYFRRDDTGTVVEVLGVLRDVSDVVQAEERLTHDALHDALTGLPNRALLLDRLEAALLRSAREDSQIAVLFCDLDGFKYVNDMAGHAAGDAVLIETARRLRGVVREGDTVARVGGDEFVLIVEPWGRALRHDDISPESDRGRDLTVKLADRVIRAIQEPFTVHGVTHEISVSIGVSYPCGADMARAGDVIEEADAAMYLAKSQGKNRVEVFAGHLGKD